MYYCKYSIHLQMHLALRIGVIILPCDIHLAHKRLSFTWTDIWQLEAECLEYCCIFLHLSFFLSLWIVFVSCLFGHLFKNNNNLSLQIHWITSSGWKLSFKRLNNIFFFFFLFFTSLVYIFISKMNLVHLKHSLRSADDLVGKQWTVIRLVIFDTQIKSEWALKWYMLHVHLPKI